MIIPITYCTVPASAHLSRTEQILRVTASLTVQHRLVQTPVDTQAVLFLLHASFTLAAVQRGGQQRRHGVLTLVSCPGPQLHAAVPCHTLPEGAQSWAAGVVAGAGVSSTQAVPPSYRESHAWNSCKTNTNGGQVKGVLWSHIMSSRQETGLCIRFLYMWLLKLHLCIIF